MGALSCMYIDQNKSKFPYSNSSIDLEAFASDSLPPAIYWHYLGFKSQENPWGTKNAVMDKWLGCFKFNKACKFYEYKDEVPKTFTETDRMKRLRKDPVIKLSPKPWKSGPK